jgi:hypothetical protein
VPEFTPAIVAAPPRPWHKRPLTWVIAIVSVVVAAGASPALMLTVFASHPAPRPAPRPAPAAVSVPDQILAHDGYAGSISISGSLWQQALSATGGNGADVAAAKAMLSSGTVGFKGDKAEIVFGLTPAGQALIPAELPYAKPGDFGPGNTAHMDRGYFVIDGPQSQLGGPSDYKVS